MNGPDFVIIGAMKCGTTTLHDQLAAQAGVFMTTPKEPCYFSDDEVYARGAGWYASLFSGAPPGVVRGETGTHYTKLPNYPQTVRRMRAALPDVKLVYIMRHPIDRLVSQYIHEWTQGRVRGSLDRAVEALPEMVEYGRYAMQLAPWFEAYERSSIYLMFLERLKAWPQEELERLARFLEVPGPVKWRQELTQRNVSAERLRKCGWRDALVNAPGLSSLRRHVIPRGCREAVKRLWRMQERPTLSPPMRRRLEDIYDHDLEQLRAWTGVRLRCTDFTEVVTEARPGSGVGPDHGAMNGAGQHA